MILYNTLGNENLRGIVLSRIHLSLLLKNKKIINKPEQRYK